MVRPWMAGAWAGMLVAASALAGGGPSAASAVGAPDLAGDLADALSASDVRLSDLFEVSARGIGLVPDPLHRSDGLTLAEGVLRAYTVLGLPLSDAAALKVSDDAAALPPVVSAEAARLLAAILDGHDAMRSSIRRISPEDVAIARSCPSGASLDAPPPCTDAAARIAAALDQDQMAGAALHVLRAIERAEPGLRSAAAQDIAGFADPAGLVRITGPGSDLHQVPEAGGALLTPMLMLDLGGDDRWLGPVGAVSADVVCVACTPLPQLPPPLPVDRQTVGYGSLVSVALDFTGNDYYGGSIGAQGSGRLGIGILIDYHGSDTYQAGSSSQGAGDTGVGILADLSGLNEYYATSRSQGYATVGGIGLAFGGFGFNRYYGSVLMQGAASNQGAGAFLLNIDGPNTYSAVAPGTTASQGASHLVGVGVMVNVNSVSRYVNSLGARGFVFPGPLSAGLAQFLDVGGRDHYGATPGRDDTSWAQGAVGDGRDTQSNLPDLY